MSFKKYFKNKVLTTTLIVLVSFLIGASTIYFTPLKYGQLIEPKIDDIDATAFYQEYTKDKDKYIFLDVRQPATYNNLHAEGADNEPLQNLYNDRHVLPRNTDKEIILICSGGLASGVAYSYLEHYGFRNIHRIQGGIESWVAAGLPVVSTVFQPK